MATKLRRLRFSIVFKILAWAVCVASVCGGAFAMRAIGLSGIGQVTPNYAESYETVYALETYTDALRRAYFAPDDDTIRRRTDERIAQLRNARVSEIVSMLGWQDGAYSVLAGNTGIVNYDSGQTIFFDAYSGGVVAADEITEKPVEEPADEITEKPVEEPTEGVTEETAAESPGYAGGTAQSSALPAYERGRLAEIIAKYDTLFNEAGQYVRDEAAAAQARARAYIQSRTDMDYVITEKGDVTESTLGAGEDESSIVARDAKMITQLTPSGSSIETVYTGPGEDQYASEAFDRSVLYVAPTLESAIAQEMVYEQRYEAFSNAFTWLVACIIAGIASLVWVLYSAGKSPHDERPHIHAIDNLVYFDIGFLLMLAAVAALVMAALLSAGSLFAITNYYGVANIDELGAFGVCVCLGGAVSAFLLWATSLARRRRYGDAGRFTLAYAVFGAAKKQYDAAGVNVRAVLSFIGYAVLGVLLTGFLIAGVAWREPLLAFVSVVLMVLYIALSLRFLLKKAAGVAEITKGVERIKSGDLEYAIPLRGNPGLDNIAGGVNNIAEGLSAAVHKEVRSERMKTELITNLSHDLKTPLTSILTYVDLLSKEQNLSEDAKKYIDVLDTKSHRLKVLTDDLFEAAKAQSGDMAVTLSRIELTQFMQQALGEISDRMEASALTFLSDIPQQAVHVNADGKLLFRVVGNVMDNAIKYAMPGSRVYLDMVVTPYGAVRVTVKNVSREELNITEDELMERFVRGDSSRNTEGSGLGLAIARNFMKLMGGRFLIEIDGDLFKAVIELPLPEPDAPEEEPEE